MTISAKIIADSLAPNTGTRLTTWVLTYPRMIHAEFLTHRAISRNASSSRAIPVHKQLQRIETDPAMPVEWGANKAGMQATEYITPAEEAMAKQSWLRARDAAVAESRVLVGLNVHKQIANRVAEPWSHISVVASATEWANFFSLRFHPAAQPEFRVLAETMAEVYRESAPKELVRGEWHLPFVDRGEEADLQTLIKCSVARCARVSYLNHDGTVPEVAKDLALYDRLAAGRPMHASPTEHQATPFYALKGSEPDLEIRDLLTQRVPAWGYPFDTKYEDPVPWSANFRGWFQYRQSLGGQNATKFPWEAA